MMPRHTLTAFLCLTLLSNTSWAENAFAPDPEAPVPASVKPGERWSEAATALPPWPSDADLIEFAPDGPPTPFRYFIDERNLRIGADEVVRYTVVAEARSGTRNVSFEGIRCTPRGQYKVFAYGLSGRFDPLPEPAWESVSGAVGDRYREALWGFHLCIPREFRPRPRKDMIRSLKGRIAPRQNTGFQAD